jgi:Flp pilus assembly protein TadD
MRTFDRQRSMLRGSQTRAERGRRALVCVLSILAGCRTTEDIQRDYAQTLTPKTIEAPLTPDVEPARQIREYKVRVYADGDYQRQSVTWSGGIEGQIARANRVLETQFGVRLVVKEIKSWNRPRHTDSLDAALGELMALDKAQDVDWVMGFVSSLEVFAATQEQIGRAENPGHHLVLRGMFSPAEVDALNATLNKLSQEERDNVTRERRLHKQTASLLHEWAHTLGAFHERSSEWLMSPYYNTKQSGFSPESVNLLLASLKYWDATDAAGRRAWAEAYRDAVASFPAAVADQASLEQALRYSASLVGTKEPGVTPVVPSARVRPGPTAAPRVADPLLQTCYVAQARAPRADETLASCRCAADASNAPPEALLLLGRVLLAKKEVTEALTVLAQAETQLAAATPDADTWVYLAQLYDRADTCTGAERAAQRAPGDPAAVQVMKDCTRQRRSVALVRDPSMVPFAKEHLYVAAMQQAQREIEARHTAEGLRRLHDVESAFPGSAGAKLLHCLADGLEKDTTRAEASCRDANGAAPEAFVPWLVLGKLAIRQARWDDASKDLQRAIELDDTVGEAWRTLAAVYVHQGDSKSLSELKASFRSKFRGDLTPVR